MSVSSAQCTPKKRCARSPAVPVACSTVPPPAPAEKPAEAAPAADNAAAPADEAAPATGKTKVEMSRVVRPGAAAEGTVSFGSGASAVWVIDQLGRLGLEKVVGEYTENDIREFQQELARLFGR